MARKRKLIDLYKSLNDKPLNEQDIKTWNSPSGELHKIDHDKQNLVDQMLYEAVMASSDLNNVFLVSALDVAARNRSRPEHWPWNQELLIDQLIFNLFERQMLAWENHVD